MYGDLCKHLGIDSSTDHPDRYSNLFLNAYINRHEHAEIRKYLPLPVYEVQAIRVNTTKSTYTFTSVVMLKSHWTNRRAMNKKKMQN